MFLGLSKWLLSTSSNTMALIDLMVFVNISQGMLLTFINIELPPKVITPSNTSFTFTQGIYQLA